MKPMSYPEFLNDQYTYCAEALDSLNRALEAMNQVQRWEGDVTDLIEALESLIGQANTAVSEIAADTYQDYLETGELPYDHS